MHRVLNLKHRIVRRVDVDRAPLATFDPIDLGDGDGNNCSRKTDTTKNCIINSVDTSSRGCCNTGLCDVGVLKPGIIGGNHSKKALSQTSGEGKEETTADPPQEARDNNQSVNDVVGDTGICQTATKESEKLPDDENESKQLEDKDEKLPKSPKKDLKDFDSENSKRPPTSLTSCGLTRQGTIGRVSIPIKKQSSVSSSSSSEACNDSHFTFTTTRPSIAHLDSAEGGPDFPDSPAGKSTVSNLVPDNIDPKQILSPSKRKAYEKRLERLKVTTSPIARPRSNAPINVVTLDEYANLSSPESSPVPHSVLHDKLKITLPTDEFTKPSKFGSARRKSEDTCFEFSEEILFRCTKSALVVDEDGQFPVSPRRVLIPPTITPTNSPKLSSPRLGSDDQEEVLVTHNAPKLIFMKEDDTTHRYFGLTFDEHENENWADFPDSALNFEKADTEKSEKVVFDSSFCPLGQEEVSESETSLTTDEISSTVENEESVDLSVNVDHDDSLQDYTSDFKTDRNKSNECIDLPRLESEEVPVVDISQSQTDPPTINNPPQDVSVCLCNSTQNDIIESDQNNSIPSISNQNEVALVELSKYLTVSDNSESFIEADIGDVVNPNLSLTSNAVSLLDGPSDPLPDETSIILPTLLSSPVISTTTETIHTDTTSSIPLNLNPFLQDPTLAQTLLDASEAKDIKQLCTTVEPVNHQSSSIQSQLFVDSTFPTTKSSSSSLDLIDFSSLDVDLPAQQ